jgi:Domain of unknown function (DUF4157)
MSKKQRIHLPLERQRAGEDVSGQQQTSPVLTSVQEVLASEGQPLDGETQAFMEPRFGHDFSQVRIHTDERAEESAQAVNALAFSSGESK